MAWKRWLIPSAAFSMPRRGLFGNGSKRGTSWRLLAALWAGVCVPLEASADSVPQAIPFSQSWTNTDLIVANDDWSRVQGILGIRGDGLTTLEAVDPRTVLGDGGPVDVIANQPNPNTLTNGGVAEFHIPNPVVALNGSGTADAPHLIVQVNTTGYRSIHVAYVLRDLDSSTDDSVQPVALQFRASGSGPWTNVPAGFVADASAGPSLTLDTPVSVDVPPAANDILVLQIRVITTNAVGFDEWIGVDDIQITGQPTFSDASAGPVGDTGNSVGLAWGDFDNDGAIDLYISNIGANKLLHNEDDGTWVDQTSAPLGDSGTGAGVAWGDYDNDGYLDLYLANGGQTNKLFHNEGDGTFVDATNGPMGDTSISRGIAWGDFDNDGNLDLYLVNNGPNKLFHNEGGGVFVDATNGPLGDAGNGVGVACADFDNDGYLDIYIANFGSPNRMLRNTGNGSFVDATLAPMDESGNSEGVAVGDYDNDGRLDVFLSKSGTQADKLFRNLGNMNFADVTSGPLGDTGNGRGVAWGDYDNDGDLDLYLANTGANKLFRNDGAGVFVDATSGPLGDTGIGRGVAWADYDNDGDLDLYLANNGPNKLLQNDVGDSKHWLHVSLVGTVSNRSGIGARVRVVAGGVSRIDEISGGSGYLSQNSLCAEFGLGSATTVDLLEVLWPSGRVQSFVAQAVDRRIVVVEPAFFAQGSIRHEIDASVGLADASQAVWITDWNFDGPSCNTSGWTVAGPGEVPPGTGHLISHPSDNDVCSENTTCAWVFTDNAPACSPRLSWGPGGSVLTPGIEQFLTSPLVDVTVVPAARGTLLSFREFPGNSFEGAGIAMNWSVRSKVAGVLGPWKRIDEFESLGLWNWVTRTEDLSAYVDPAATHVQVRFQVADWGPSGLACATNAGAECGAGPGPYLDRVQIGRRVISGPVISEGIDSRSQAQDCFPAVLNAVPPEHYSPTTDIFGTSPFSAGADEGNCGKSPIVLTTDAIGVQVVDGRGVGGFIEVNLYCAIVAGPHAGKSPVPYSVNANGFFTVPVLGPPYAVDLDDTYFRGGDVLLYVWTARDLGGGFTSDPPGLAGPPSSVTAAEAATGGLHEVSFLPKINWDISYLAKVAADPHGDLEPTQAEIQNSTQANCILYVQMANSRRRSGSINRTSFMYTLDGLGYGGSYDVYDVQGFGNTNNHLAGRATPEQAGNYAIIIQDSGRRRVAQLPNGSELDSGKLDQAQWYQTWLGRGAMSAANTATLWLIGENLVEYNSESSLLNTMGVTLVGGNQSGGRSPGVEGVATFTWENGCGTNFSVDKFSLDGGCPLIRDFDGLGASGTAVVTHRYFTGGLGDAAIVMNKDQFLNWNTVLSAFSWSDISDAFGTPPATPEFTLAQRILNCALPVNCHEPPVDAGEGAGSIPRQTALHENVPNPFNPVTKIHFDLAQNVEARLCIYDVSGRLLRTLVRAHMQAGSHAITWDGVDDRGSRLPSGIYFYRLVAGDFTASRRMVLLK